MMRIWHDVYVQDRPDDREQVEQDLAAARAYAQDALADLGRRRHPKLTYAQEGCEIAEPNTWTPDLSKQIAAPSPLTHWRVRAKATLASQTVGSESFLLKEVEQRTEELKKLRAALSAKDAELERMKQAQAQSDQNAAPRTGKPQRYGSIFRAASGDTSPRYGPWIRTVISGRALAEFFTAGSELQAVLVRTGVKPGSLPVRVSLTEPVVSAEPAERSVLLEIIWFHRDYPLVSDQHIPLLDVTYAAIEDAGSEAPAVAEEAEPEWRKWTDPDADMTGAGKQMIDTFSNRFVGGPASHSINVGPADTAIAEMGELVASDQLLQADQLLRDAFDTFRFFAKPAHQPEHAEAFVGWNIAREEQQDV